MMMVCQIENRGRRGGDNNGGGYVGNREGRGYDNSGDGYGDFPQNNGGLAMDQVFHTGMGTHMTMIFNGRVSTVDFYRILVEAMDQVFLQEDGKRR